MSKIADLRAKRAVLAQAIKAQLDASNDVNKRWDVSDQEKYDSAMAEIDAIEGQITREQNYIDRFSETLVNESLENAFNSKTSQKDSQARAIYAKYLRNGEKAITAEEWISIRNTLSTTTGSQGGFAVQSEVASTLVDFLKAYGGVREVATVINTELGNPLSFPTSDGTAETGELIAENTTATSADPVFGTVAVNAYKFSSKVVAVPFELLQDAQIDVESFVNTRLADRIGRITNSFFTTGTGTAQPGGVAALSSSGKVGTTGQTLTVIFDDLVDLEHSVDIAYRRSANCSFMLNDASFKVVKKLKDTQGRPIFIPGWDGFGQKAPDTILGYRVVINNDVAVMAANAKSILFGDFSKYIVRDVMGATLFRFDDSAYIKLGQIGFLMWARSGGNLTDTTAVKYYQNSAT